MVNAIPADDFGQVINTRMTIYYIFEILYITGTICGLYGLAKEQMDKLGETPAKGSLYSFGPNSQFVKRWSDIRISNGLAWNDKISKFYYIDTLKEVIDQYDFDINTGSICIYDNFCKLIIIVSDI